MPKRSVPHQFIDNVKRILAADEAYFGYVHGAYFREGDNWYYVDGPSSTRVSRLHAGTPQIQEHYGGRGPQAGCDPNRPITADTFIDYAPEVPF